MGQGFKSMNSKLQSMVLSNESEIKTEAEKLLELAILERNEVKVEYDFQF